jgi:TonB family protein
LPACSSRLSLAAIAAIALQSVACASPSTPRLHYVRPPQVHYPFTMLDQGIEGYVMVGVVVGRDGKPKLMWIAQSSGRDPFDKEAMNALSLAVWVPPATDTVVMVPINFVMAK